MKIKMRNIAIGLIGGVLSLTPGCSSDYLETNPSTSVSESLVGSSIENLYMAINGIHRKMVSQDRGIQALGGYPGFMICLDSSADDMTWAQNNTYQTTLQWQEQWSPESAFTKAIWQTYYEFILNANLILSYVDRFENSTPTLFRAVKGEALCFRAFGHFMLVQMYGSRYVAGAENTQPGVPYRLKSTSEEMPRNSVEACYTLILQDLDAAIALLEGYKPKTISHYSQSVAYGLKARVTLAQQNYAEAAISAGEAIREAESNGFVLMSGDELYNGFSNISTTTKEALWAALTLDDQTVNYYSFYSFMSWNYNSEPVRTGAKQISSSTYQKMSATDLRRLWWDEKGTLPLPSSSFTAYPYSVRKFKSRSEGDAVGNVAFMRLSELYLTQAEAYARNGQEELARNTLNKWIITRDPGYQSTNSGSALIEEIMTHRRIELWGEGFRFFDLKRLNLPLTRTGSNFNPGFCLVTEIPASDPRWQWAIPQDEIDANPLIIQNIY